MLNVHVARGGGAHVMGLSTLKWVYTKEVCTLQGYTRLDSAHVVRVGTLERVVLSGVDPSIEPDFDVIAREKSPRRGACQLERNGRY